ncbi:Eco57I restriction-modification methylase domain-containing protein [Methylobacterium mesophilicum]|uniref:Eco57I restriction-modification methylase domain-containing protein n=1 Tax=Methylobacterium mesophilicum TaxID=39956 RepID=UPI002F2FDA56
MIDHTRLDDTAEWLNYLQPEGLVVGANVLRERELSPVRQTAPDTDEAARALGLPSGAEREDDRHFVLADPWRFFEKVLGWPAKLVAGAPGGPALPADLARTVPEHGTFLEPAMALLWNGPGEEGVPAQALVALHPDLDPDGRHLFGAGEWEASPHARLERLVRETGIGVGVLVARNCLRLIYAPRGETAGWLTFPLAALGRVEGRPMLAGLKLCLGRRAFFTGAPETRLRALLKASREAQDKVSEKLSGQVLGALHELLRGLHRADPEGVEALVLRDSHHLYEGLLVCLMRLVFLLYAEDRDLLPSSSEVRLRQLWESGYSIRTLYARLLADEALNPDTMDQRRGGWGQLLAVFRLVHGGHPGWVTGRGGKLFDPDVFPFLEGRAPGQPRDAARVLPVSDGTVLRILHGLMTVEGRSQAGERIRERLSYRALDVESIGSVYETVMGFTALRAEERMIALRDEKRLPAFVGLDSLLAQKPAERQKWLKERAVKLSAKQQRGVKDATDASGLIAALGSAIDERASPDVVPLAPGAPYLQPTEERRRSGSHYTPRSLTEPIVRHALEPAFARIGTDAAPESVLSLKVLDPACGSGAFLVEACRQLGARLEQAWTMHPAEKPPIPADEDEATHACRLVAQKCLYGVDRNPMAVDLARLSLWLATLAREHEFSFLDHALKSGDSLVGLTRREIQAVHWDASKPGLPLFRGMIEKAVAKALEGREAIRNAADDVALAVQTARHRRVEHEVEPARIVGDAVIATFFSSEKPRAREIERQKVESWIAAESQPDWDQLQATAKLFRAQQGWRPFHWEIEFPEVFARNNPGFDAIVGNPPFLGGLKVSNHLGMRYFEWLTSVNKVKGHTADLVAYFLRRSYGLLNQFGAFGLLATNTVSQGDTREAGLEKVIYDGGTIFRAIRRLKWPGEAAVIVSAIHIARGKTYVPAKMLNGTRVQRITPFLLSDGPSQKPSSLESNAGKFSQGTNIRSPGFLFGDNGEPSTLADLERIRAYDPVSASRIYPYLGGSEINSSPTHEGNRFVINVSDISSPEELKFWPSLEEIIRAKVKPERDALGNNPNNIPLKRRWWAYHAERRAFYERIKLCTSVLVNSQVSPHLSFAIQQAGKIWGNTTNIFLLEKFAPFCVVQSRIHEIWARFFASSMKDDLRYAPTDCFETFPFPLCYESDQTLEVAGQIYHDYRAALMIEADEGMTKTYNRFHDSEERLPAIARLRELHDAMDRAVLRAYGWDELAETLRPEFLTPEIEDDHTYQGRYFWPAEQRDLVLARLLALNAERHAEEIAAGIAPSRGRKTADEAEGQDVFDLM